MKNISRLLIALCALFLTPTNSQAEGLRNGLPAPYAAPEITGVTEWMQGGPQSLASLKGKVVLVDFWTYSCINCVRTIPHLKEWHEKYADDGLVIIGIHAPEFDFERDPENVKRAIARFGITWPVGLDNKVAVWRAYQNRYWPAKYLIDKNGQVVFTHFGEGAYDVTEHNIRTLLEMDDGTALNAGADVTTSAQTPETYLGSKRAKSEWTEKTTDLTKIPLHQWQKQGQWQQTPENIESGAAGDTLALHFHAKKVFLVLASKDGHEIPVNVKLEQGGAWENLGKDAATGRIVVSEPRLYELVNLPKQGDGLLKLVAENKGLQAFAFTFESDPQQ